MEILIEAGATSKVIRHSHSLVRPINFIAARGYHGDGSGRRGGEVASEATERYENSSARAARTPPLDE